MCALENQSSHVVSVDTFVGRDVVNVILVVFAAIVLAMDNIKSRVVDVCTVDGSNSTGD